jgi:DNA mismatch repair protein MutS
MFQQYHRAKAENRDAILLFRMGDFYEMFFDDAILAAGILDITLTARGQGGKEPVPMCGVPVHAVDGYLARLVEAGHQVAMCEQVEDPRKAKGLVRREVVRVISPGTLTHPDFLEAKDHRYLAAFWSDEGGIGAAYLDLSAGDFQISELCGERRWEALEDQLASFAPREVLVPEGAGLEEGLPMARLQGVPVRHHPAWAYDPETSHQALLAQMGTASLEGFGVVDRPRAVRAGGALLHYLRQTQKDELAHINRVSVHQESDHMLLDAATLRNLEVVRSLQDSKKAGSLLGILDLTRTGMGGRLLKAWLLRPLRRIEPIQERHATVAELADRGAERDEIREALGDVLDLERLLCRVTMGSAHPRDLGGLRDSFARLPGLGRILGRLSSPLARRMAGEFDDLGDLADLLGQALDERPPVALREGGILRDGYHEEVDELRGLARDARSFLTDLEARERERTGITSLKVRFNKVFGYYIEVSKPNLPSVPEDYVRKQTLVNAERFITPELKEYEAKILHAKDRLVEMEYDLFLELRGKVAAAAGRVRSTAGAVATLDVLAALAEVAVRRDYVRPSMHEERRLEIRDGRHPVVEVLGGQERFVPNDTTLDAARRQILVLTGPNMGGKSTFLRQTALICILAQAGSFVPARAAHLPVLDRAFSRVGASDNLAGGQSTFMVEMQETANILHNATGDSLVVLDEIGRGTSTFDGLSLAWAVVEQLHQGDDRRPLTLFATHYHELTELDITLERVFNQNIAVREWNDDVVFLRKVVDGAADQSYGIHVARLAGIPETVIRRAREVLENLEAAEFTREGLPRLARSRLPGAPEPPAQMSLFVPKDPALEEVRSRLQELDPERLTPMEALALLVELRKLVGQEPS